MRILVVGQTKQVANVAADVGVHAVRRIRQHSWQACKRKSSWLGWLQLSPLARGMRTWAIHGAHVLAGSSVLWSLPSGGPSSFLMLQLLVPFLVLYMTVKHCCACNAARHACTSTAVSPRKRLPEDVHRSGFLLAVQLMALK